MKTLLLTVLIFMMSVSSFADGGSWEFAGWYGGGCFPNAEFDPKIQGRVYLTSDVAGLYRSDDNGEHWTLATKGLEHLIVAQVIVAPSDSNVLYAATGNGIFVSNDAAASWRPLENLNKQIAFARPGNYRSIAVDPANPTSVCAGTSKGKVFCSSDHGKTWKDLNPKSNVLQSIDPVAAILFSADSKDLFIGSSDGIFRYNTAKSQWSSSTSSPQNVSDLAISTRDPKTLYAAADNDLWISRDWGATWARTDGDHTGSIFRIAVQEQAGATIIFAAANEGWNGTVIRSDNEGQGWRKITQTLILDKKRDPTREWANPKSKSTAIKVNPFNPAMMLRTDWWGVWRSDDSGVTWIEKINGAPNTVGSDIAFGPDNSLYVSTMDNGLLKSDDNGTSYQPLFPKTGYHKDINGHVWRVAVNGSRIIATSSPWGEKINQVIISNDNGATFKTVRDGLPTARPKVNTMWGEGYPRALAVDPQDPNMVYLGIDGNDGGGLFISKNGGNSWQRSTGQPGSLRIYNGLVVDVNDSNILYWAASGDNGGIYKSEDKGKTWSKIFSESSWVFDLHMSADGTLYAAASSQHPVVYGSKDKGKSWKKIGDFPVENSSAADGITSSPNNPDLVAVSTVSWGSSAPQKIYLSRNAGQTWEDITNDLPQGAGAAAMTFDRDGKYLYLSRYAGSVYRIKI